MKLELRVALLKAGIKSATLKVTFDRVLDDGTRTPVQKEEVVFLKQGTGFQLNLPISRGGK